MIFRYIVCFVRAAGDFYGLREPDKRSVLGHLRVFGEYGKLGLFAVHKIVSKYAESIRTYSENTPKVSKRTWRRRKETLGVFS